MRFYHRLAVLGGIVVAGCFVLPPLAVAEPAADVETAVDSLTKAMLSTDGAKLKDLTLDALDYGHSGGRVEDKATFVDALVSKRSTFTEIKLSDRKVAVTGDLAVARHVLDGISVVGGKSSPVHIGVVQVWKRDGGKWRMLVRQAYKL